jgi:parallel beta-helix repeat protein
MWLRVGVVILATAFSPAFAPQASARDVIHVPGDQPTIQAGIDVALTGDIVLVAPGTYYENVDFKGKAISVMSADGPRVTFVDGGLVAPVVTFSSGEGRSSVLQGFTIQHGSSTFESGYDGGGVDINGSSPTVVRNIITDNVACDSGGGVAINSGSPLIKGNLITRNSQSGCSGGVGGGGIKIAGAASAQVVGNIIADNSWSSASGGGISLFSAGTPLVANNIIRGNSAGNDGGAFWIVNQSDAMIVQNLIIGNTAGRGGGIYWLVPLDDRGPFVVNNTIADNSAAEGSGVWAGGFQGHAEVWNNIIVAPAGESPIFCDAIYDPTPPLFRFNNAFSPDEPPYQGTCSGQPGQQGNISVDPLFVAPGDYHLQALSPSIDAGDNSAPNLPAEDIDGDPRIANGVIDQGFDEAIP